MSQDHSPLSEGCRSGVGSIEGVGGGEGLGGGEGVEELDGNGGRPGPRGRKK